MTQWHKTACVLCAQNCGLDILVKNNKIAQVRPDKTNPRSQGYVCRKGMNVANHQHHADRLTSPLKYTPGGFEKISWEQAVSEIAHKLRSVVDKHGPRAYAYMGGGGQGSHFEAAFGRGLMRGLGSRYHYGALAQELTGHFWACGRATGRQNHYHTDAKPRMEQRAASLYAGDEPRRRDVPGAQGRAGGQGGDRGRGRTSRIKSDR